MLYICTTSSDMIIPIPIRFRVIAIVSLILTGVFLFYIQRDSKEKNDYEKLTGILTYIEPEYGDYPVRHIGKYRYLQIESYPFPFEIFIGKDFGDFKPKFEQIDKLKTGDVVTLYYYETENDRRSGINRNVQFIDKNGISYFERGSSKNVMAVVMIFVCFALIGFSYYGFRKGKIQY